MRQRKQPSQGLFMIGIAVLFLAGFLMLVIFGAQIYRNVVAGENKNMHTRALSAYLSTAVRNNDTAGAVKTQSDPDFGQVLVIADGDTGYALRLYKDNEGRLLEDLAPIGDPLWPESAQAISDTDVFEISELNNGLISVRTDEGSVLLRIRSEGGAEE